MKLYAIICFFHRNNTNSENIKSRAKRKLLKIFRMQPQLLIIIDEAYQNVLNEGNFEINEEDR